MTFQDFTPDQLDAYDVALSKGMHPNDAVAEVEFVSDPQRWGAFVRGLHEMARSLTPPSPPA